jgi:hypothetical protein
MGMFDCIQTLKRICQMFRSSSDLLQCKLISESLIVEQIKRWHCYVISMDVSITTTKKRSSCKLYFICKDNDILQQKADIYEQVMCSFRCAKLSVTLYTAVKKIDVFFYI